MMRAVGFKSTGLAEDLFVAARELPKLRENECLVKVVYSAINRADTMQRKGLYPPPPGESDILGLEAVGYVHNECSSKKWRKHDRVMCLLGGGGNAEFVNCNENNMIRIPDWMSYKQAAAIPEVWLTAFQLLYWVSNLTGEKNLQDKKVLVHAGASGVGTSLIQMLKKILNVKHVYATVGSEDKKAYLENDLHVTKAFNYKLDQEKDFDERILNLTNNTGVNVVFDCVGASYWQKNLNALAMDGEWILYGSLGGSNVNGDILARILKKRIHLKSSTLRARTVQYKDDLMRDFEEKILNHFKTGLLQPIIDSVYDMEQIADAHKRMESNANIGKILIRVSNEHEQEQKQKDNTDL